MNYEINDKLRVLSAPCSTGEETYSIAMFLQNLVDCKIFNFDFKVLGLDIDAEAIRHANKGIYETEKVKNANGFERLLERYTTPIMNPIKNGPELCQISEKIRKEKKAMFGVKNLMEPLPSRFKDYVDVVFCKNLIIYLNEKNKSRLIENLQTTIKKDGLLIIGASESGIGNAVFKEHFEYTGVSVYMKK
ncbi:MAG: CheR family methyltransferase [Nanoarchaeota archaeon]|nr:CheR family methyltransferase [Nanoarchaeota archaeon]